MFYLTCFDIVDDRARHRVVKNLKAYGVRVQKSVFECSNMTEEKFLKMKARLEDCIDTTEDSIRYYRICKGCIRQMEYAGIGEPPDTKDYHIL